MRISLYLLAIAGTAILSGTQSARAESFQKPLLASSTTVLGQDSAHLNLLDNCEALAQSLNQVNQSILDTCLTSKNITPELREKLDILSKYVADTSPILVAQANPLTLEMLQQQIDALKNKLTQLESEANFSASLAQQREQELEKTVDDLTNEVSTLKGQLNETKLDLASVEDIPSDISPVFKPTITFNGSANMLYGGVDGDDDSAGTHLWKSDLSSANRNFSDQSFSDTPLQVTGASNRAGGKAYRYYFSGQSQNTFPPNGLESVNRKTAESYAMASSWTGGKVRFNTLSNGGDLVIVDKNDPNYVKSNPRTLDYGSAKQLTVDFQGLPMVPNVGTGGLKNSVEFGDQVDANDFTINNLGNEITFSGISLSRDDVQNLIDLGNASRSAKGVSNNMDVDYVVGTGETISTIAFKYGTTASKLLSINPGLGLNISEVDVLSQGTELKVPSNINAKLTKGDNTVSPGGLVDNKATYDDLLNLAIAEYGSLTDDQRSKAEDTAQRFIRGLAKSEPGSDPTKINNNFMRAYTFNHDVKLNLTASLWGPDMLRVTLRHRNYLPYGSRSNFPGTNLAFGFGGNNNQELTFDRLWWKLPVSDSTSFWVGTRLKDYHFLPVRYGNFYPVEQQNYFFATAAGMHDYVGSGIGLTANNLSDDFLGGQLSFGAGYLANSNDAINPVTNSYEEKGLVGRDTRFRVPVQLGYTSDDGTVIASLNYIFSNGDTLNCFVGTTLACNPFYFDTDQINQVGLSLGWQFYEKISFNAAYNEIWYTSRYDSSVLGVSMVESGDNAKARSWMAGFVVDDWIIDDSKIGIAVGNVPYIYENDSAWGTDEPPFAFETWFNWDLSDYISVQPGVFLLTNHDGLSDAGTDWGMTFRTYLKF